MSTSIANSSMSWYILFQCSYVYVGSDVFICSYQIISMSTFIIAKFLCLRSFHYIINVFYVYVHCKFIHVMIYFVSVFLCLHWFWCVYIYILIKSFLCLRSFTRSYVYVGSNVFISTFLLQHSTYIYPVCSLTHRRTKAAI